MVAQMNEWKNNLLFTGVVSVLLWLGLNSTIV